MTKKIFMVVGSLFLFAMLFAFSATEAKAALKGDGSKGNPYQIGSADELMEFADMVNSYSDGPICPYNAILTANIMVNDMMVSGIDENGDPVFKKRSDGSDISADSLTVWEPIGNATLNSDGTISGVQYGGVFYGDYYSIRGLYLDDPNRDFVGLFGYANVAAIDAIMMHDCYFRGNCFVGCVAGYSYGSTFFRTNISPSHSSYITGNRYVGGICGTAVDQILSKGKLMNGFLSPLFWGCSNGGIVTGIDYVGGMCGKMLYGCISECNTDPIYRLDGTYENIFDGSRLPEYSGERSTAVDGSLFDIATENAANSVSGSMKKSAIKSIKKKVSKGLSDSDKENMASASSDDGAQVEASEISSQLQAIDKTAYSENTDNGKTANDEKASESGTAIDDSASQNNSIPIIIAICVVAVAAAAGGIIYKKSKP